MPLLRCVRFLDAEEQVEANPNNIALIFKEEKLTYFELNQRVNQLAHYLRNQGVKPNNLVVLCLERGFDMIISILGILKAGGAYVPVDPGYPSERFQYILEDTLVTVIITDKKMLDKIPSVWSRVICLENDWQFIENCPKYNPNIPDISFS